MTIVINKAYDIIYECGQRFEYEYGENSPAISVELSNRMTRTWGYATKKNGRYFIKLNAKVCNTETVNSDAFKNLVIHEFCHIADNIIHGQWGHGHGWSKFMRFYGISPNVYVTQEEKAEVGYVRIKRKITKYAHSCTCKEHVVHGKVHNKILRGSAYTCRLCGSKLSTVYKIVKS